MFEMILIVGALVTGGFIFMSFRQQPRPEGCTCKGRYNSWVMEIQPECPVHKHHLEADLLYEHVELENLKK